MASRILADVFNTGAALTEAESDDLTKRIRSGEFVKKGKKRMTEAQIIAKERRQEIAGEMRYCRRKEV